MITIKSNLKNRIRLKSKLFTRTNFDAINLTLAKSVHSLRLNEHCNSIIIYFDNSATNLDEILRRLNLLFEPSLTEISTKTTISKNTKISRPVNSVQNPQIQKNRQICSQNLSPKTCCELCQAPKKLNLLKFCVLCGTAIVVFVKEHILLTPFSPFCKLAIGAVSLISIIPSLKIALKDAKDGKFSLETFMSFSLFLAILLGEIAAAFEVIFILEISHIFERYCAQKSHQEIRNLINLGVKKVYILRAGSEIQIDLSNVKLGDIVVCVSSEKIAVDGTIIWGEGMIDEALINGRSEAVLKQIGDKVFANTTLQNGKIHIKVEAMGDKTYISRIISKVDEYLLQKSPSEILADKLAQKTLKIGSFMSLATLAISASFQNAFSVMIVMSCPCATILAASSAISSAIAKAAKNSILIKGGAYLENLAKCDIFCFDKTGTLTTGMPIVSDYKTNINQKEFFEILLNLEHKNTHPVAKSIIDFAKSNGAKISPNFQKNVEISNSIGLGVSAKIGFDKFILGNAKFMKQNGISLPKNTPKNSAATMIYLAKNGEFIGFLALIHEVRENSKEVLEILRKHGVKKIVLLTGDDEKVAKDFAKSFDFDEIFYDLMPQDKAKIVKNLSRFGKVVMIGDGVNDTLAMSMAEVSLSFVNADCQAAIETSNIALSKPDLMDIVRVYELSKFAIKIADQNYKIGTFTNIIGAILAMLGFIAPSGAGLLHIAHTSAIIANSSRINLQ